MILVKIVVSGRSDIEPCLTIFSRKELKILVTIKGVDNIMLTVELLNHFPQKLAVVFGGFTHPEVTVPKEIIPLLRRLSEAQLSKNLLQLAMQNPSIKNVSKLLNVQPLLRDK